MFRVLVFVVANICMYAAAYWLDVHTSSTVANLFVCAGLFGLDCLNRVYPQTTKSREELKRFEDAYDNRGFFTKALIGVTLVIFFSATLWVIIKFFWGHLLYAAARTIFRRGRRWYRGERKHRLGEEIKEILLGRIGYRYGLDTSLEPTNLKRYLETRPDPKDAKRIKEYLRIAAPEQETVEAEESQTSPRQAAS